MADDNANGQGEFQSRMQLVLTTAPRQLLAALQNLELGELNSAVTILNHALSQMPKEHSEWTGTFYCCRAFCFKEMERFQEAVESAWEGAGLELNLVGKWYYHDVMDHSLNCLDSLDMAYDAACDAISFYEAEGSTSNWAIHLERKANILKQMAAYHSRDEKKQGEAKAEIIDAINSICKAISLIPNDLEEAEGELEAIYHIAARVGVRAEDLNLLNGLPNIDRIVDRFFTNDALNDQAVAEYFNKAIDLRKQGERSQAVKYFLKALSICKENTLESRAYKAFISYQFGVCLLIMHNLEGIWPSATIDHERMAAIKQIQDLWNFTLNTYNSLDSRFLADFDKRFPLSESSWNIKRDPLMSIKTE
mgnify:CR=1 FL=1